jgi:outer membrane protein assembly factor BamB
MRAVALAAALLLTACTSGASRPGNSSAPTAPTTAATSAAPTTAAPTTASPAPAAADWPTYHGNAARTGVASALPAGTPRLLTTLRLDGQVYAAPIVAAGISYVATENDTVYAFDAAYRQLWKRQLGAPSPAGERPCGNIDPLGITGTPVYAGGTVYVAPEFRGTRHELLALDARTGAVRWQRSLDLPGVEARAMQQRGALTVAGGRVWVPFGGLAGDCGGYKGRVIGYALDGSGSPVQYTVPTAREAGIWTPPGPTLDGAGNLLVSVGNGASGPGDRYDFSDSVLRISTRGELLDSFSPASWASDNAADKDLGSQGPALVGGFVFIAGKSGTGYVLRAGHLGGIGGQVSSAPVCRSFGGTAVDGDVVYVPCTDGLRAVRVDSAGRLRVLWHANAAIAGSPIVGGGRVWSLDQQGGVLHALDPATGRSVAQVAVGATSRFATPAANGGDLLVPTLTGLSVVRLGG